MKCKLILLLLVFLPRLNNSMGAQTISCVNDPSQEQVIIDFRLPSYDIRDTSLPAMYGTTPCFQFIDVHNEEFGIIDSIGMPCLPQITFDINLPNNAENISLHYTDSILDKVSINNIIIPYQKDFSADDSLYTPTLAINGSFYSSNDAFYKPRFHLSQPYNIRGRKGVRVTIFPFCYYPKMQKILVLLRGTFVISYSCDSPQTEEPDSPVFENYYTHVYKNYSPKDPIYTHNRYLIITPSEFVNAIEPFVDYKTSLGYDVDVESISPANMSSSNVKDVISQRYNNPNTRPDFILLVGDSDKLPPSAGAPSGDSIDKPITDIQYVLLEGSDLDVDAFIGRWPIVSTYELENIIRKTIYMEMNMQQLEKNALFVSGDDNSWWPKSTFMKNSFEIAHDYAISHTFVTEGYSCEHRKQPYLQTVRYWMSRNPLIFSYSGHGSFMSIGKLYYGDTESSYIYNSTLSEFNNQTYPMVFAFACKTGNFAYTSVSIGESWIRHIKGGVTYFGSSVKTLNTFDIIIEKKVFGDAFTDAYEWGIGKMIALGMRRFRNHFFVCDTYAKRFSKSYNLMGDPSLKVRGLICPKQLSINSDNIVIGDYKEYHASEKITVEDVLLNNDCVMFLSAGNEIVFGDGFEAVVGAELDAWIEDCQERTTSVERVSMNEGNNKPYPTGSPNNTEMTRFHIYPNPTSNDITLEFYACNTLGAKLQIHDMQGIRLYEKDLSIVQEGNQQISLSVSNILPRGSYIITLKMDNLSYSKKLIIQ